MNRTSTKTFIVLFLFAIICACHKSEIAPPPRQLLIEQIPSRNNVIVVLGSSSAQGVGAEPLDSSWASKLKNRLLSDFQTFKFVNLAMSGYTTFKILPSSFKTADTLRNVDKALTYKPDLIIISLPSNDMANGYTDKETLDNFKTVVEKIKAAKVAFIIMSTQPRDFPSFEARQKLALFNDKLEENFPNKILNVFNKLASPSLFINVVYGTGDGIHLNNKGHNVIFQTITNDSLFRYIMY